MPLTMLDIGKEAIIASCRAKGTTQKFLEGLGIIPGNAISILSEMNGNLIICIKGARVAINRGVANQVVVKA